MCYKLYDICYALYGIHSSLYVIRYALHVIRYALCYAVALRVVLYAVEGLLATIYDTLHTAYNITQLQTIYEILLYYIRCTVDYTSTTD